MNTQKVKLVCFSPTGTTKAIVQGIARGINAQDMDMIDITSPGARTRSLETSAEELLIVAVPVYMGRVPAIIHAWLNSIKACNTPVVSIVVYGNRAYENALLELRDILVSCGCRPIAAAAFIAEHSFSSPEFPSSVGRPDQNDLHLAEHFGRQIAKKMLHHSTFCNAPEINIPGSYPYGGITDLWKIDFIEVSDACQQCGLCSTGCPAGAIDSDDSSVIKTENCTLCCACIKQCPQNARSIKPGMMKEAQKRCVAFSERKEPEFFL